MSPEFHADPETMEGARSRPFVDTVPKIIAYYDYVKAQIEELDRKFTPEPENLAEPYEPLMSKILTELENGAFNPGVYIEKGIQFHRWEEWNLAHFGWEPNPHGIIDYEELTRAIRDLQAKVDEKRFDAKIQQAREEAYDYLEEMPAGMKRSFKKGTMFLGIKVREYGYDLFETTSIIFRAAGGFALTRMHDENLTNEYKSLKNDLKESTNNNE